MAQLDYLKREVSPVRVRAEPLGTTFPTQTPKFLAISMYQDRSRIGLLPHNESADQPTIRDGCAPGTGRDDICRVLMSWATKTLTVVHERSVVVIQPCAAESLEICFGWSRDMRRDASLTDRVLTSDCDRHTDQYNDQATGQSEERRSDEVRLRDGRRRIRRSYQSVKRPARRGGYHGSHNGREAQANQK